MTLITSIVIWFIGLFVFHGLIARTGDLPRPDSEDSHVVFWMCLLLWPLCIVILTALAAFILTVMLIVFTITALSMFIITPLLSIITVPLIPLEVMWELIADRQKKHYFCVSLMNYFLNNLHLLKKEPKTILKRITFST